MTQVVDRPPGTASQPAPAPAADLGGAASPVPVPPSDGAGMARPALAIALVMVAVAVMTGGIFDGWSPRVFAAAAGIAGVGLAMYTERSRQLWLAQIVSTVVIAGLAILAMISSGVNSLNGLGGVLDRAATEGRTLPTPLAWAPEWRFLLTLVSAAAGYGAAWLAIDLRRPRLALLLPLPILVFAAIAQPQSLQTPDAIAAFAVYALAVAVLYRDTGPDSGLDLSPKFEIRRTGRAAVVVACVVIALVALNRADFLFPAPAYDPTKSSQLPHAASASQVADRVLFTVKAPTNGPWRIGVLNSYEGTDWRLPPFSGDVVTLGREGPLDPRVAGTITSTFTINGLEGPSLPTPTRAAQVSEAGGSLDYDRIAGAVRVSSGVLPQNLTYKVSSAPLPAPSDLTAAVADTSDPADTRLPMPPPREVSALLAGAPPSGWARADYVRLLLLQRVVIAGTGEPTSVPAAKVVDMLQGSKRASPFELVAGEALLERWAGIPARIGYGYENGEHQKDGSIQVHPKNASTWLEVRFRGLSWFPVTGGPLRATPTLGDQNTTSASQPVVAGPDIAVNLFVPIDETTPVPDYEQIRPVVIAAVILLILAVAGYLFWPLPYKAFRRARRRAWARRTGNVARLVVAYAEFREYAIDLGDDHAGETPLRFLEWVMPDLEHTELAWAVTRVLWGDIAAGPNEVHAAETMSRSLRRRLARGQPGTLRVVAALSRQSLRHPYWAELDTAALRRAEAA